MKIRRGASALEFALTLPVVMVVLAGILEYGWYLFQLANVVHALRDGTRIGVTVPLADTITPTDRAEQHARSVMNGLGVPCDEDDGCTVTAVITPSEDFDVPFDLMWLLVFKQTYNLFFVEVVESLVKHRAFDCKLLQI